MFERFTDRARRVLVLAQEEARLLNHDFIGTEHLLLGLIQEGDGVGAQALENLGVSLADVRARVHEMVGSSGSVFTGSPPFTPRAKKVLELSLREALQFGHTYIGTEHILLGLAREAEGVAAQVLSGLGADMGSVRQEVVRLISRSQIGESRPMTTYFSETIELRRGQLVSCSFCGRRPPESGPMAAGERGAYVCEHCVSDLHERLVQNTESPPVVTPSPVIVTGRLPADEESARVEIARAYGLVLALSDDRRTVPSVEGGELLGPCLKEAQERHAALRRNDASVIVDHIRFIDEAHASVMVAVSWPGTSAARIRGEAVRVESAWKVARTTFCELMKLAGVECPPA